MQESRLFKILYHLLEKGHVTAQELAKQFEVSVRTIYRDIDSLSEAGIPVYAEKGRNGGIFLLEDFTLNKVLLSEKEKKDILASLQSLSMVGAGFDQEMLTKLSALFQVSSEDWFEADFSRWGGESGDNEKFESIKTAVIRQWYVKAFCTKKQEFRIFKLNRMVAWEVLEEEFEPVPFPELQEDMPIPHNKIVLRFSKEMAYRVYDEFDTSLVERMEDGDLVVSVHMQGDDWLIGYLLSFGTQVEVVEPLYLRDMLAQKAKEIYEQNKI